jgi:hypothetical protein
MDRFNRNNVMEQLYELYEGFDGGMKKKYTKKHRTYKQKRNTKRNAQNKYIYHI